MTSWKAKFQGNLKLHLNKKKIANQLAKMSGGKYTSQQIEDQMRLMGVTVNGAYVSGAPDMLVGDQAPTDSGATWMYAGTTADRNPVLTPGTVPVDAESQQYISMYGGSATSGQVPTGYKYEAPRSNGSGVNLPEITGPFTQVNSDDLAFVRSTTSVWRRWCRRMQGDLGLLLPSLASVKAAQGAAEQTRNDK